MLFGPSWTTFAGSVALSAVLAGVGGFVKGCDYEKDKATSALLKATQDARQKEDNARIDNQAMQEVKDEEIRRVAAERDRAVADSLRNRASKRLPTTPSACNGASPTALAAPDTVVAIGWGSDFDELRAEYAACKAWADKQR